MALVAIYAAAGFLWAPRLIRSQAEEFVSENYGRKVDIGEIRFNPFTFELNVGRFVLPDADGKPGLSFDSLRVNLELSSLWRRGASFKVPESALESSADTRPSFRRRCSAAAPLRHRASS